MLGRSTLGSSAIKLVAAPALCRCSVAALSRSLCPVVLCWLCSVPAGWVTTWCREGWVLLVLGKLGAQNQQ